MRPALLPAWGAAFDVPLSVLCPAAGLVQAPGPGQKSALEAALGVAPSDSPLSATLLLQASTLDDRSLAALQQARRLVETDGEVPCEAP